MSFAEGWSSPKPSARSMSEKHDQVAYLLTELRADRDRVADELKATESHRVALEGQLESATGGMEQLRAAADRALVLAREIAETCPPDTTPTDVE